VFESRRVQMPVADGFIGKRKLVHVNYSCLSVPKTCPKNAAFRSLLRPSHPDFRVPVGSTPFCDQPGSLEQHNGNQSRKLLKTSMRGILKL
jgi:hypothetical protein